MKANKSRVSGFLILVVSVVLALQFSVPTTIARSAPQSAPSSAGAGLLDPGFGQGGKEIASGYGKIAHIAGMDAQPDGDYIVAGDTNGKFILASFHPDGSIDTEFGDSGRTIVGVNQEPNVAEAMMVQHDGKIVIVGTTYVQPDCLASLEQLVVLRFNTNGTLDENFGNGGIVMPNYRWWVSVIGAVAENADGKLVVGWGEKLFRLLPNGVIDKELYVGFSGSSDVLFQSDGKMVIVANDLGAGPRVRRYNSDWSLDTTFGENGIATIGGGYKMEDDAKLAIAADGKIGLAGTYLDDFALARFNNDGSPDTFLNASGFVNTDLRDYYLSAGLDAGYDLIILDDNRTIVGGVSDGRFALVSYRPDGALDPEFGVRGRVKTDFGGAAGINQMMLIDDKLIVAGFANNSFALARYELNGNLDTTFGSGGTTTAKVPTTFSSGAPTALGPEGEIVVGTVGRHDIAVRRFNNDGAADADFAVGGVQTINPGAIVSLAAIAVQRDGKIVGLGSTFRSACRSSYSYQLGDFVIWRDNPDGELDLDFSFAGILHSGIAGRQAGASALAIQPNGKILVAGPSFEHSCQNLEECVGVDSFGLARLAPNSDRDPGFGDIDDPTLAGIGRMAGQPDDKIVVQVGGTIRRYTTNAQLDPAFGSGGVITPTIPITALVVQPDGKLLLAGGNGDLALARYLDNGTLDPSFGSGGVAHSDFGGQESAADMALQPDGKIVLVGARNGDFAVVRYNSNGTPDSTFGNSGLVTTDFGGNDGANKVAVNTNGKITVSGGSDGLLAFARYLGDSCGAEFNDVAASDYYYGPAQYLYCHGAISGYADGSFRPANTTTRAQIAKIVVLATDLPLHNPSTPTFSDVPSDSPFCSYIETAAAEGIVSGYGEGTFRPNGEITRGQLSKMIVLAEGWSLLNPTQPSFADVDRAHPFYSVIETALAHGIVSGYDLPDGGREFRWGSNATRGQVAKIVYLAESNTQESTTPAKAAPTPEGGSKDPANPGAKKP